MNRSSSWSRRILSSPGPTASRSADFQGWVEERGHSFMHSWDPRYQALTETHDPGQDEQKGGSLVRPLRQGRLRLRCLCSYTASCPRVFPEPTASSPTCSACPKPPRQPRSSDSKFELHVARPSTEPHSYCHYRVRHARGGSTPPGSAPASPPNPAPGPATPPTAGLAAV